MLDRSERAQCLLQALSTKLQNSLFQKASSSLLPIAAVCLSAQGNSLGPLPMLLPRKLLKRINKLFCDLSCILPETQRAAHDHLVQS